MHSGRPYVTGKQMQPRLGYYMQTAPVPPAFNGGVLPQGIKPLMPLHSVDIQESDACPKNFVIFDQTTNRSHIMFHPEISSKFFVPGFGDAIFQDNIDEEDSNNDELKTASPFEEDSDDIDALLSTEEDETEERDDDEVSTARTYAVYECNSPDSCSNYESISGKSGSLFRKPSGSCYNDKKRKRMRKMVKALRGIVPGANRMTTVAVLDEAVRYLKSLGMELQKPGPRSLKG